MSRLIEEIQAGNSEAFARLYHEFHTAFFYMAYKLTNNEADAHDAVQDTFIKIQKSIKDLKNPNVAIVWMKKILFNRCKNMFRNNRDIYVAESALLAMEVEEESDDALPETFVQKQWDRDIILRLLAKVPYLYREVLILKYYDDAKMSEIAKVLGIPEGTVKSRLRTGKKLLKEQIASYESTTKERVPYHVFPLGWSLFFALQKEAARVAKGEEVLHSHLPRDFYQVALCSVLSVCALMGAVLWQQRMNGRQELQKSGEILLEVSDQKAYFYIKRMAHCADDLIALDEEKRRELAPFVELLIEHKGLYYDLLCMDEWLSVYEKLIK